MIDALNKAPADQVIWTLPNIKITAGVALHFIEQRLDTAIHRYSEKNIALCFEENNLDFLYALILFGTAAKTITIVPSALSQEDITSLISQAQCHHLITDMNWLSKATGLPNIDLNELTQEKTTTSRGDDKHHTQWLMATSGTTSTPKLVKHTLNSLTSSLGKKPQQMFRWGLVYDLARFAGLQVFLQSLLTAQTLLVHPRPTDLNALITFLVEHNCNALSATPSYWRKITMMPDARNMPLKQITLGGEAADQGILDLLSSHYPKARITHIYASTEAGVGFSVKDGLAGFSHAFLEREDMNAHMKISDDGELLIRPTKPSGGYVKDGQATPFEAFIPTGDMVEVKGDRVYFLGRKNGSINVGGNKFYPEEVEQFLLSFDEVSEAVVVGRKNPILGQVCEAQLVTAIEGDMQDALREKILNAMQDKFPRYKIPAKWVFGQTIAISGAGKKKR